MNKKKTWPSVWLVKIILMIYSSVRTNINLIQYLQGALKPHKILKSFFFNFDVSQIKLGIKVHPKKLKGVWKINQRNRPFSITKRKVKVVVQVSHFYSTADKTGSGVCLYTVDNILFAWIALRFVKIFLKPSQ